jgi:hypothetical protein
MKTSASLSPSRRVTDVRINDGSRRRIRAPTYSASSS